MLARDSWHAPRQGIRVIFKRGLQSCDLQAKRAGCLFETQCIETRVLTVAVLGVGARSGEREHAERQQECDQSLPPHRGTGTTRTRVRGPSSFLFGGHVFADNALC